MESSRSKATCCCCCAMILVRHWWPIDQRCMYRGAGGRQQGMRWRARVESRLRSRLRSTQPSWEKTVGGRVVGVFRVVVAIEPRTLD